MKAQLIMLDSWRIEAIEDARNPEELTLKATFSVDGRTDATQEITFKAVDSITPAELEAAVEAAVADARKDALRDALEEIDDLIEDDPDGPVLEP